MHMVTFTKKKIKRLTAIGLLAAATAAAGIGAVITSVGTQATERQIPVYCVERGDNKLSLTFDVAWENSNTQELIDILDEYDARATFFVTGDWCDRYPEDVRLFADAGHEIQNHSDVHPHVKGMNVNDLISDTKSASQKIRDITGKEPTLYRAPYGEYDDTVMTTIEGMGLKVIQWDAEKVDTDGNPLPEPVYRLRDFFCNDLRQIHKLDNIYLADTTFNHCCSKEGAVKSQNSIDKDEFVCYN